MKEDISVLIALQELDTELSGFDRKIEEQKQELTAREQAIAEKEALAGQCKEKAVELEQSQRDIKAGSEDAAERIKDRQSKMMQVQTSREHQALLKEIEEAKKTIKDAEEQQLQVLEQVEAEEAQAKELENLCTGERKLLAEETGKVEKAIEGLNKQRLAVQEKRDQLAQNVPSSRIKRYNKLLKKREGLAVVQVIDAVCQGCFMTIPPQKYNDIRLGEQIYSCPTCQRTLYYLPEPEEADA
ncbi:MAG: C4-type zinc ribbon domain-containing protein [Candidatus Electrothrix sp. GW3-4]|uniref:zinc ribbon domain-containing protein n=1 Tax=Candidatus Electrothrix sp. GW3-4 TaxID=3126740 RepID=UPI0030D1FE1E